MQSDIEDKNSLLNLLFSMFNFLLALPQKIALKMRSHLQILFLLMNLQSLEKRNQLLILTVLMKLHTVYTLVVVTLSRKMMPPMLKHRVIISVSHQLILLQILCLLQIPTSVRQVMLFSTVHLLLHSQIWSLPQVLLLSMWLLNLEELNQLLV